MLIKQSSSGDQYLLIKGHNPNFVTTKAKSPYQSGYQISLFHAPPRLKLSENVQCCLHSVYTQTGPDVLKLLRIKGHQNLCIKTGSERQFDIFDGKYRRLSEPYVMTLQLAYHNYEMLHYY